jgi:hypothetical protein
MVQMISAPAPATGVAIVQSGTGRLAVIKRMNATSYQKVSVLRYPDWRGPYGCCCPHDWNILDGDKRDGLSIAVESLER